MYASYVAVHRKAGTLEQKLNESKLDWCWENDYEGDVELVSPDGSISILHCSTPREKPWLLYGEMAVVA